MAATTITKTDLTDFNTVVAVEAAAAIDATDGALVTYDKMDSKILLMLENTNATTAYAFTIEKGNGIQGVNDLAITVTTSSKNAIVLESGKFKNVSGDNKGKVVIKGGSTYLKVSAIALP